MNTNSTTTEERDEIACPDLKPGDRVMYPSWFAGTVTHSPKTIGSILEYPHNRVLYFDEGGYGIADRRVRLAVAR